MNRRIFHWAGYDRAADTIALTAAVAETVSGLCNRDGRIARLNEDGSLDAISLAGLHSLIDQHLCGLRIVKNGAGFKREYFNYSFDPAPHPGPPTQASGLRGSRRSDGPDAAILREIYDQLPARLPRVVE
jgi:hypothetical protein